MLSVAYTILQGGRTVKQTLVIGSDSITGRAVAEHLTQQQTVRRIALSLSGGKRAIEGKLKTQLPQCSTIIFCGGSSRSSWDANFGQFQPEERWLPQCVVSAQKTGARLVMVSSDAVFTGPTLFHDDNSACFADDRISKAIRNAESMVSAYANSLIVRTNVVDWSNDRNGFCNQLRVALESGRKERVTASNYSTPMAAETFATTLTEVLATDATGIMNIAGAERTTPFHFAHQLAVQLGFETDRLLPESVNQPKERSLRCGRLRDEIGLTTPMLRETIPLIQFPVSDAGAAAA